MATSTLTQYTSQVLNSLGLITLEIALLRQVYQDSSISIENGENPYKSTSLMIPIMHLLGYLIGIVFLGQKYFDSRKSWNVEGYMLMYNAFQFVFNTWVVICVLMEMYRRGLGFAGNKYVLGDREEGWLGFLIYAHYQNKFVETMDTVFMVVRKKRDQVSTLHIWHHSIMTWCWLMVLWVNPGGDAFLGVLMNSFVHSVMYSYYFLSSLKVSCPWKKYVTKLQLTQFAVVFVQGWYVIYLGSTPTWLTLFQQALTFNMLYLFSKFYKQEYSRAPKDASTKKKI
jgi:elongation of very long chain fatty acids protein 4